MEVKTLMSLANSGTSFFGSENEPFAPENLSAENLVVTDDLVEKAIEYLNGLEDKAQRQDSIKLLLSKIISWEDINEENQKGLYELIQKHGLSASYFASANEPAQARFVELVLPLIQKISPAYRAKEEYGRLLASIPSLEAISKDSREILFQFIETNGGLKFFINSIKSNSDEREQYTNERYLFDGKLTDYKVTQDTPKDSETEKPAFYAWEKANSLFIEIVLDHYGLLGFEKPSDFNPNIQAIEDMDPFNRRHLFALWDLHSRKLPAAPSHPETNAISGEKLPLLDFLASVSENSPSHFSTWIEMLSEVGWIESIVGRDAFNNEPLYKNLVQQYIIAPGYLKPDYLLDSIGTPDQIKLLHTMGLQFLDDKKNTATGSFYAGLLMLHHMDLEFEKKEQSLTQLQAQLKEKNQRFADAQKHTNNKAIAILTNEISEISKDADIIANDISTSKSVKNSAFEMLLAIIKAYFDTVRNNLRGIST